MTTHRDSIALDARKFIKHTFGTLKRGGWWSAPVIDACATCDAMHALVVDNRRGAQSISARFPVMSEPIRYPTDVDASAALVTILRKPRCRTRTIASIASGRAAYLSEPVDIPR